MITYSGKSIKGKNVLLYSCDNIQDFITLSLLNITNDYNNYIIDKYIQKINDNNSYYVTLRICEIGGFK